MRDTNIRMLADISFSLMVAVIESFHCGLHRTAACTLSNECDMKTLDIYHGFLMAVA